MLGRAIGGFATAAVLAAPALAEEIAIRGLEEIPAVEARREGAEPQRFPASRDVLRVQLEPGDYVLAFASPVLTPLPVKVEAGRATEVDLAARLGTLRVEGMDDARPAGLEVVDEKGVRVAYLYPNDQRPWYALAPGRYGLRWNGTYLSPFDVEVKAGEEVVASLPDSFGKLVVEPMEGVDAPWMEVLDAAGQRIAALYPDDQSPFYGLAPGRYRVRWNATYLSPLDVELKAGETTVASLPKAFGKLAIEPMEGAKTPWMEVLDAAGERVAALYPDDQSPFYGLAPGRYRVRWNATYLSPVDVEAKAGEETRISLARVFGKVAFRAMEDEAFSWMEVLDEHGARVAALYPNDQSPFYGLAPGRYGARWNGTYLSPVAFEARAGEETVVDLRRSLAKVRVVPMDGAKPVWFEIVGEDDARRAAVYPQDQTPFYGVEAGSFALRWQEVYLTPVPFEAKAGEETAIDLGARLGRLEFAPAEGVKPGFFRVFDAAGETQVARVPEPQPFYGLLPGEYRVRFDDEGLPEVRVRMAAGKRTRVVPGETEASPEGAQAATAGAVTAAPGDTIVELSWAPPAGGAVHGYRVYRAGAERPIHGSRVLSAPSFVDLGLTNGRTYRYLVRAVLADGSEHPYPVATATPRR